MVWFSRRQSWRLCGKALTTTLNGVNQPDPDLGAAASLRWPRYGAQRGRINFHSSTTFNNGQNVNSLSTA